MKVTEVIKTDYGKDVKFIGKDGKEHVLKIPSYENSLMKIFDDSFKGTYRIDDKEMDYICEKATDEELDILSREHKSFKEIREALVIRNRLLKQMKSDV